MTGINFVMRCFSRESYLADDIVRQKKAQFPIDRRPIGGETLPVERSENSRRGQGALELQQNIDYRRAGFRDAMSAPSQFIQYLSFVVHVLS